MPKNNPEETKSDGAFEESWDTEPADTLQTAQHIVGDQNKEDMGKDEGFGDWDDNQNKQSNEETQSKSGKENFGDFDEAPGTTVGS